LEKPEIDIEEETETSEPETTEEPEQTTKISTTNRFDEEEPICSCAFTSEFAEKADILADKFDGFMNFVVLAILVVFIVFSLKTVYRFINIFF
jgi:hypothetical protein